MTDKRPHRGLALGKQFHDAQKQMIRALEVINAGQETTGDLAIATFVDHENRIEALECELETLKRHLSTLAHVFTAHLENELGITLEGHLAEMKDYPSCGDEFGPCEAENDDSAYREERVYDRFSVVDGDLRGSNDDE